MLEQGLSPRVRPWLTLFTFAVVSFAGLMLALSQDRTARLRREVVAMRSWLANMSDGQASAAAAHISARGKNVGDPRFTETPLWIVYSQSNKPRLRLFQPVRQGDVRAGAIDAASPLTLLANETPVGRERAVDCLAAAIHYEAGRESREGQEAVAQVVLNRVGDPHFPKTVCGVVFQGSDRATGCQFTFTCDGSLQRRPSAAMWARAREIAEHALNGYVMTAVGMATHYHAYYVRPYWSPSLSRIAQIGAHIFYRSPRADGGPGAIGDSYRRYRFEDGAQMADARLEWTSTARTARPQARAARRARGFSFRVESPQPLSDDERRAGILVLGRS